MNPGEKEIKEQQIKMHRKCFADYSRAKLKSVLNERTPTSLEHLAALELLTEGEDAETADTKRIAGESLKESKKATNWAIRSFVVAVAAGVIAVLALLIAVLAWLFPKEPADTSKNPKSQPSQDAFLRSAPTLQPPPATPAHPAAPQSTAAPASTQPAQEAEPPDPNN